MDDLKIKTIEDLLKTYEDVFPRENLHLIHKKQLVSDISWFRGILQSYIMKKDKKIKKLKELLSVANDALLEANETLRKNGLPEVTKDVSNIMNLKK